MAETKSQTNSGTEREYVIPLRKKVNVASRFKKTPKAVKTVKEFLAKHMKIRDRDLKKVKLDMYLNEFLWDRSIRNPPHKVKVKAKKDSEGIVRAELAEYPERLRFKKMKSDRDLKKQKEVAEKKKQEQQSMAQKAMNQAKKPSEQESKKETKTKTEDSSNKGKNESQNKEETSTKKEATTKKSSKKKTTTKKQTKKKSAPKKKSEKSSKNKNR